MSALTQPHTNGHDRELSGVRTYRGRKLEDLIPQIRAELGPDAIILRQREGLMGGDRKSTRLNSSHRSLSRMPSSA